MSMLPAVRHAEDSAGQQGTPDCYQRAAAVVVVVVVVDDVWGGYRLKYDTNTQALTCVCSYQK